MSTAFDLAVDSLWIRLFNSFYNHHKYEPSVQWKGTNAGPSFFITSYIRISHVLPRKNKHLDKNDLGLNAKWHIKKMGI
jgi:hypothetical protein